MWVWGYVSTSAWALRESAAGRLIRAFVFTWERDTHFRGGFFAGKVTTYVRSCTVHNYGSGQP